MTFPDFFGAPTGTNSDVQVFNAGPEWQMWVKPRGCTMMYATAIGAGAGGAGGMTGAIGSVRGGGGGGGGGASARVLIPLAFLPDRLYVKVPKGGLGGNAATNGAAPLSVTWVCIEPALTSAASVLLRSGTTVASVSTAGSTAGSAGAGAGETLGQLANMPLATMGLTAFVVGKVGAIGGVVGGGAGGANTVMSVYQLSGGGAGGGTTPAANTNFAGGAQTGAGLWPTVAGGTAGGNPGNGAGAPLYQPFMSYGGAGGGTGGAAGTVGGTGGNGGIGGGGGGGGGGVTGGRGGDGGPGLVQIICW